MSQAPLPSNDFLQRLSADMPWQEIEQQKRDFQQTIKALETDKTISNVPLDKLSEALDAPVSLLYPEASSDDGNVLMAEVNGHRHVLGALVSKRYRSDKPFMKYVMPYNFNPSVNHTNLDQTDDPVTRMRSLGAELELGLVHPDGRPPSEAEVREYMLLYREQAEKSGITPQVDREASQYQIEAHVSPVIGYEKTRLALGGILTVLTRVSVQSGLRACILPAYPVGSDFKLTEDPKVQTAVDVMQEVNNLFPLYRERLKEVNVRYNVNPPTDIYVQMFRNQGCHIHLDLAGRSEALGMFAFYTMLRSASAAANAAVLKGSPFVNGTCDPELLCTREYLRSVTVTGRYLEVPLSPHLSEHGLEHFGGLLNRERVNAPARAMLYSDDLGEPISVMHNPIGRIRPDLSGTKRICTLESTGMPTNPSAARMAAILCDFEYSHVLIEDYYRKYGTDLGPMYDDKDMWAILGPLSTETFIRLQDMSDRECTDAPIITADGREMSLADFYEMKRRFMHRALHKINVPLSPRDIDDVYVSLQRMLAPLSGYYANTIHEFIADLKLKSTGNWGKILKNTFLDLGGVPGKYQPEVVMKVVNQMHDALCARYLQQ
jgi:hypothetical protein